MDETMTTAEEHLAPIRERLAAITPGPWSIERDHPDDSAAVISIRKHDGLTFGIYVADLVEQDADAVFIANAPTVEASLLAGLDAVSALHHKTCQYDGDKCERDNCELAFCVPCREKWPCPTVVAITTALAGVAG